MESKKPAAGREEHYGIKILQNGTWLYQGTPITRHNMVKLFARSLKKDAGGGYWLVTPYEKGRISVEDTPFTAVALEVRSSGKAQELVFSTNLDEQVAAGPDYPIRVVYDEITAAPRPYVMVRDGMEARITRAVYYELAALAVADDTDKDLLGVWSGGRFFPLGRASER